MDFLSMMSGGGFSDASIFALSITPYINASIIIQLLTVALPPLERMAKDGEAGRKKLGQITRYVTVGLGLMLGVAYYFMVRNKYNALVPEAESGFGMWFAAIVMVLVFTAGSALMMVNMSGVMPIILACSIVSLPAIIASFFKEPEGGFWKMFLSWFRQDSWVYIVLYFLLIIGFAFFYVTIQYNPLEMSNNLRKNSGAIPGYRPGKPTTDYIKRVIHKVCLVGALFLGIVALFPSLFGKFSGFYGLTLGGTSIMIVVGVALETTQQIESQMMMRHYKGFLE